MGKNSAIEWTDHTFNSWIGCQKVSDGCKFCYAERDFTRKPRWANTWGPPETSERIRTSEDYWRNPFRWQKQAQIAGKPAKVFCASLADVFEDNSQVSPWRIELFEEIIQNTPWLQWLILTKRPERAMEFFNNRPELLTGNIWLGVSVENQDTANERIPQLLQIPAAVRFVSAEPLLGSIDLTQYLANNSLFKAEQHAGRFGYHGEEQGDKSIIAICDDGTKFYDGLDLHWLIVGGESGPNARPCHPDWVRSLRDQCVSAGVPFFFKQWGELLDIDLAIQAGSINTYTDTRKIISVDGHYYAKIGKKSAGRLLDGREWNERP